MKIQGKIKTKPSRPARPRKSKPIAAPSSAPAPKELDRLVHELLVHQVELETQNEELRRTHQSLEESRNRYADLYDSAPIGYLTLDTRGTLREINLTGAAMLGMVRQHLIGLPLGLYVAKAEIEKFHTYLWTCKQSTDPITIELTLTPKDHAPIQAQLTSVMIYPSDKSGPILHATLQDITERKQMEKELRESAARFRMLIENISDGIELVDEKGIVTFASPSVTRILGYSRDQIEGNAIDVIHPDDLNRVMDALAQSAASNQPVVYEYRARHQDGTWRWIEESLGNYLNTPGIGKLVANFHDITERKRAEERLRESNELVQHITEHASDLIYRYRFLPIPRFDFVSASSTTFNGYTPVEHYADPNLGMKIVHPDDASLISNARFSNTPPPNPIRMRWIRKDGTIIWVEQQASYSLDDQGRIAYVDAVVRDITERKEMEKELAESERRYHELFNHATLGIFRSTQEGKLVTVNPSFAEMFGYASPSEMVATVRDAGAELYIDPGRRAEISRQLTENPAMNEFENEYRRKNGDLFLGRVSMFHFVDSDGQAYLEGICEDIGERRRAEQLEAARLHILQFSIAHDLPDILQNILDESETLTDSQIGFFHFVDDDENTLSLQNWSTRTTRDFCTAEGKGLHYPIDQAGVWADAVRQQRAILYNDYATLPNRKGMPNGHAAVTRFMTIPVWRGKKIVAVVGVGNKATDYTTQDLDTVSKLADFTWDVVERKQMQTQLEFFVTHDALTDTYNRALFETEMERLERSREFPVSIIVADVDNLKATNDSQGHAAGDEMLRRAARAMQTAIRTADVLARIGGDEFALLLPRTDSTRTAQILNRIQANLQTWTHAHPDLPIQLSLGMATASDGNLIDAFKTADARMYQNKSIHKTRP